MPIPIAVPIVAAVGAVALIANRIAKTKAQAAPGQTAQVSTGTSVVATPVLTGTNGVQFTQQSPQFSAANILPPDQFAGIIPGDSITVDVQRAGFQSPQLPSGNTLMEVVTPPDPASMTLRAVSKDPRTSILLGLDPQLVPSGAITGIQPHS